MNTPETRSLQFILFKAVIEEGDNSQCFYEKPCGQQDTDLSLLLASLVEKNEEAKHSS